MMRLSRAVTVGDYTIRGVDDWLAFMTDRHGRWFMLYTECSPMWRELPASFVGPHGYPDDAAGVLATAILELRAGFKPKACAADDASDLDRLFR